MAIYAVVRNAKIENTFVWDGEGDRVPAEGTELIRLCDEDIPPPGTPGIDWDYNPETQQFEDNRPMPEYGGES